MSCIDAATEDVLDRWLPEVVEINISSDLLPEFQQNQDMLLTRLARLRRSLGLTHPVVRIRDDVLLASRAYEIAICGHRVAGRVVEPDVDFSQELLLAAEAAWRDYGEIVRLVALSRSPTLAGK